MVSAQKESKIASNEIEKTGIPNGQKRLKVVSVYFGMTGMTTNDEIVCTRT